MASALRPSGSCCSCSAVTTVRVSTLDTSIGDRLIAETLTEPSVVAAPPPPADRPTSVPAPTRMLTFSRVSTVWPACLRVTV